MESKISDQVSVIALSRESPIMSQADKIKQSV